jgi:hypothetical protein
MNQAQYVNSRPNVSPCAQKSDRLNAGGGGIRDGNPGTKGHAVGMPFFCLLSPYRL